VVCWVGLEGSDHSEVVGHNMDQARRYPSLGVLDDATIARRAETVRAGHRPPM